MQQLVDLNDDDEANVEAAAFKSSLGIEQSQTIHINNFPYHYEERDIRLLFKDCGEILRVAMPQDNLSMQSRGYAFVTFANERGARKAMNFDGHEIMRRPLRIRFAENLAERRTRINDE